MTALMANAASSGLFMASMHAHRAVAVTGASPRRRDRIVVKQAENSLGTEPLWNSVEVVDHVQRGFRQIERVEMQRGGTAFDQSPAQARDEIGGELADAFGVVAIR